MNMNPWHVDNLAELNRQRIRDEMKQIRLELSVAPPERPVHKRSRNRGLGRYWLIRAALALLSGSLR
jgi:hypothetical protein